MEEALTSQKKLFLTSNKVNNKDVKWIADPALVVYRISKDDWMNLVGTSSNLTLKDLDLGLCSINVCKILVLLSVQVVPNVLKGFTFARRGWTGLNVLINMWSSSSHLWLYDRCCDEKSSFCFICLHSKIPSSIRTCSSFWVKSIFSRSIRQLSQWIVTTDSFHKKWNGLFDNVMVLAEDDCKATFGACFSRALCLLCFARRMIGDRVPYTIDDLVHSVALMLSLSFAFSSILKCCTSQN